MEKIDIIENIYSQFMKNLVIFLDKELSSEKNSEMVSSIETVIEDSDKSKDIKYHLKFYLKNSYMMLNTIYYTKWPDGSLYCQLVLKRRLDRRDIDFFEVSKSIKAPDIVKLSYKEIIEQFKDSSDLKYKNTLNIDWESFDIKKIYKESLNFINKNFKNINSDKKEYERNLLLKHLNDIYNRDFSNKLI